jgi:hypothetical protein
LSALKIEVGCEKLDELVGTGYASTRLKSVALTFSSSDGAAIGGVGVCPEI